MHREDFDKLVQRLEAKYAHRPGALRWRVVLWVVAGYVVLFGWLIPLLILGGIALFGGAGLLPAPAVWLIVGAVLFALGLIQTALLLSIRVPAPKGVVVTRTSAPGLFQELDRLSESIRCRHFHRVQLTPDFNAAVYRVPRLGLLGWSRPSLLIGWPLLTSLSPAEARGVLAHEFAHLSREHGRFGHWLYGLNEMWGRVIGQLQTAEQSATIRKFLGGLIWGLNWFWPRLHARMFLLSRAAEYEADAQAAETVGAEHLAQALWRIDCLDFVLRDEFWPEMQRLAARQAEPPDRMLRQMDATLRQAPPDEDARRWMTEVCQALTDQANTHPSFSDRVAAMGFTADEFRRAGFPGAARGTAATAFFGTDEREFEEEVSAFWKKELLLDWRRRHGRSSTLNRRLSDLPSAPVDAVETNLDVGVLWERARMVADVEGVPAAEPVLRQLLAAQPTHVYASLMLGQHLLEREPGEGIRLLRRVITSDRDDVIPHASNMLMEHFRRTGAQAELEVIRKHMAAFEAEAAAARKERGTVTAADTFEPHELTRDELTALQAILRQQEDLGQAWLAQKALQHFPHRRLFVLCVEARRAGWWGGSGEKDQALASRLIPLVRLPGQVLVIAAGGALAKIAKKARQVPESSIHGQG